MFERFTKEARDAVVAAQQVARDTGSRSIDTRHLLVAVAEADGRAARALTAAGADDVAGAVRRDLAAEGLDPEALAAIGIDLAAVTRRAEAVFGRDALRRAGRRRGHLAFGKDARKALELALRETIRLQQREIDSGHLLLGILRADNPARAALVRHGVDLPTLRDALEPPEARSA